MRRNFRNILIVLHIIFAAAGFYIYLYNYQLSENLLVQKTLSKQEVVAKAGSLAVENLIKSAVTELSSFVFTFAKVDENSVINKGATRTAFLDYMSKASVPINEIAVYDESGKLLVIENRENLHTGENQNFSDRDFIQWSKDPSNKNKLFISDPYLAKAGASLGKTIIVLAEPIYFGSKFKGTLAIRILVDDFKKAFIDPLVADMDEDSFIIDTSGVLLAGKPNLQNQNLFVYAQNKKWSQYNDFITNLKVATKQSQTQTSWVFQNPGEDPKILLAGISKIDVPNTDRDLYLVVVSSKDNVTSSLTWLRRYGFIWLGFGVLTTIAGGVAVIFLKAD